MSTRDYKPRPRDAEATRRALLRAAQRRFGVLGYERTTTRDIADDAGVNPALINRYFGGKDGLLQAVLAEALVDEPREGDLVDDFLASLGEDAWPEFGHHPLVLLLRDTGADEQIQALRSRSLRQAAEGILARSGLATGRSAEIRAQMVLALFSGLVVTRFMTPVEPLASAGAEELRAALQDAVDALLTLEP